MLEREAPLTGPLTLLLLGFALLFFCFCFAFALLLLCFSFAFALLLLCFSFAVAFLLLCCSFGFPFAFALTESGRGRGSARGSRRRSTSPPIGGKIHHLPLTLIIQAVLVPWW